MKTLVLFDLNEVLDLVNHPRTEGVSSSSRVRPIIQPKANNGLPLVSLAADRAAGRVTFTVAFAAILEISY